MEWNKTEADFLKKLNSPAKIQDYLDSIEYNPKYECRSPRLVMQTGSAHCFEGALFSAAALEHIGHRPLIVDMKAYNDDDHVIAVFMYDNHWGSIAKSNFTTLRFREPVYRTLRELIMSYFDFYFNVNGDKSLRSYSRPLDLSVYDKRHWKTTMEDLEFIGDKLESMKHFPVVTDSMLKILNPATETILKASLLGSNEAGLFRPS
ncbi:MAG TPA: hypothetical protein VK213_12400 [Bacteroidales bacterium]|nr:hypothetical protein [Bacteroidales bacterium]